MDRVRWGAAFVALAFLLTAAEALAAESAVRQGPVLPEQKPALDDVIVLGSRLYPLRKQIDTAEDRFYALYDELNTKHEFDVHCAVEAPLDTRFTQRGCEPVYQARAEEAEAHAFLEDHAIEPSALVALARKDDYRRNMLEILRKNPRRVQLLRERVELQQRYKKVRQERFKGHWILFE